MANAAFEEIVFEMNQIDLLFANYAALFDHAQHTTPDLIETTAIASVLHSFYNGLENIFMVVAKRIDQSTPTGDQWHRKLLSQMTQATDRRAAVLSPDLALALIGYLGFRHFYRHSYSFFLDWRELAPLCSLAPSVWTQIKSDLQSFLASLSAV